MAGRGTRRVTGVMDTGGREGGREREREREGEREGGEGIVKLIAVKC